MNSWISISHIPGVDNMDTNIASRILSDKTEWELDNKVYKIVCKHFNFHPTVDLFVSRLNNKCK